MAKKSKSNTFTKAIIDKENGTITEYPLGTVKKEYQIEDLLTEWDGIDNISITIRQDEDY